MLYEWKRVLKDSDNIKWAAVGWEFLFIWQILFMATDDIKFRVNKFPLHIFFFVIDLPTSDLLSSDISIWLDGRVWC